MSPNPIEPADKSTRQRRIRGSLWFTLLGTNGVLGAAYALLPPLPGLAEPGERLVLAVRWLLVAFIPYVAPKLPNLTLKSFRRAITYMLHVLKFIQLTSGAPERGPDLLPSDPLLWPRSICSKPLDR
jgi:hypothetical protein